MSTPDVAIDLRGLRKRYGAVDALQGLDLQVPAGSIYGFLGRNGAGKTTTIKALMGMIRVTAGEGVVLGHHVGDTRDGVAIRRRTAHVGEDRAAWPSMTADQVLVISRPLFPHWRVDVEQEAARLTGGRLCPYTAQEMTGRSTITAIMTTTMRKHGGRAVVSLRLDTN